jgi:hypothetical protein
METETAPQFFVKVSNIRFCDSPSDSPVIFICTDGRTNGLTEFNGRVKTQAVSRWLPTAAAWVRARVRLCGICGGQSGIGTGTSVSLANLHSTSCPTITIIYQLGLVQRPVVAAVRSGLSLAPLKKLKN